MRIDRGHSLYLAAGGGEIPSSNQAQSSRRLQRSAGTQTVAGMESKGPVEGQCVVSAVSCEPRPPEITGPSTSLFPRTSRPTQSSANTWGLRHHRAPTKWAGRFQKSTALAKISGPDAHAVLLPYERGLVSDAHHWPRQRLQHGRSDLALQDGQLVLTRTNAARAPAPRDHADRSRSTTGVAR